MRARSIDCSNSSLPRSTHLFFLLLLLLLLLLLK